jgi:hypothetical protein
MGSKWRSVCAAALATEAELLWRSKSPHTSKSWSPPGTQRAPAAVDLSRTKCYRRVKRILQKEFLDGTQREIGQGGTPAPPAGRHWSAHAYLSPNRCHRLCLWFMLRPRRDRPRSLCRVSRLTGTRKSGENAPIRTNRYSVGHDSIVSMFERRTSLLHNRSGSIGIGEKCARRTLQPRAAFHHLAFRCFHLV